LKKAKFHIEAAAMAGHEVARCNLGIMENNDGIIEQAVKHWTIAASASTLAAYNNSCTVMRSKARDGYIHDRNKRNCYK